MSAGRAGRAGACLVAAVLVVVLGCGRVGAAIDRSATSAPERVVRRYVEALAHGDVTSALALRCPGLAVPQEPRALFSAQAKTEWRRLGRLRRVVTAGIDDRAEPRSDPSAPRAHVAYRVVTSRGSEDGLRAVLVRRDGAWSICGFTTSTSHRVCAAALRALQPGSPTNEQPRALVDIDPGHVTSIEDQASPPPTDPVGYVAGWTRAWKRGSFGGDRATARQFVDEGIALQSARRSVRAICADGTETFRVPDVQGAIGIRARANAWIGLQSNRRGPFVDSVVFTRGPMAVSVAASPLKTGTDHAQVQNLATRIGSDAS